MYQDIRFNGYNLASIIGVRITAVNIHPRAKRDVSILKLGRAAGAKLVNAEYGQKEIVIEGDIAVGNGRAGYDAVRDNLLLKLEPQEAALVVPGAGAERQYTATVEDIIFSETGGGKANFSIKFVCAEPFGYATTSITGLNASSNTVANSLKTLGAPILGSYKAEPTMTVTVSAVTGATGGYIKLTNPSSGKYIKVSRTFANSDVLVVNCRTKTVTVNGTAVDYTGVFPTWEPGDTTMRYEDYFTTRTVLISFTYTPRYQ